MGHYLSLSSAQSGHNLMEWTYTHPLPAMQLEDTSISLYLHCGRGLKIQSSTSCNVDQNDQNVNRTLHSKKTWNSPLYIGEPCMGDWYGYSYCQNIWPFPHLFDKNLRRGWNGNSYCQYIRPPLWCHNPLQLNGVVFVTKLVGRGITQLALWISYNPC